MAARRWPTPPPPGGRPSAACAYALGVRSSVDAGGGPPPGAGGPDADADVLSSADAGRRVVQGGAQRVVSAAVGLLISAASSVVLLRHLGVEDAGRYVTVMSLVGIAGAVAEAGLTAIGTRDMARAAPAGRSAIVGNLLGLRLLVMPVGLAIAVVFAVTVGYSGPMVNGTVLAGLGIMLVTVQGTLLLRLVVELRNGALAINELVKQLVTLLGFGILAVVGAGLQWFFAVQVAVGLVVLASVPLLAGWRTYVRPRWDRTAQRQLALSALPVAAALVLAMLYVRLIVLLMSLVSTPEETGLFGASLRVMDSLSAVPILIAGVALPVLTAAARDDHERLRNALQQLAEVCVIAGALLYLVSFRLAEPAMVLLGGSDFAGSGEVLRIHVGALIPICLVQVWSAALIALDRPRALIVNNAIGLLGVAALATILVPASGAVGGGVAALLADVLLAALTYRSLRRAAPRIRLTGRFMARLVPVAALAAIPLAIPVLPDPVAAAASVVIFSAAGLVARLFPEQLLAALRREP